MCSTGRTFTPKRHSGLVSGCSGAGSPGAREASTTRAAAATDPSFGGSAPGIGFAIPASTVKTIADQIVRTGKVTDSGRAALGITGRTVVDQNYQPAGVAVVSVESGGAADKAGIQAGDIITRLTLGRQ